MRLSNPKCAIVRKKQAISGLPEALLQDFLRVICVKLPVHRHWIDVVPPAKNAFVGTRDIRSMFHALVRGDAVKGVLVAATFASAGVSALGFCLCFKLRKAS